VEERQGTGANVIRHLETITRTAERMHVSQTDSGIEWLFVRNAVDARRASASLIDSRARTIVEFDESELRNTGVARGWADVVALGVWWDGLQGLEATGREQTLGGYRFVELRPKQGEGGPFKELWWSHDAVVPSRLTSSDQTLEMVVKSISPRVDAALLLDPRQRFPGYEVQDVADYREKHHEHSEKHSK
jgi:hypothetical protein